MTLLIIDECTHNKTFSVYDKPNGTIKILEDSGFHLNPRVHDNLPPLFISDSESDGPRGNLPSSAQTSEVISTSRREHKDDLGVNGLSDNFREGN